MSAEDRDDGPDAPPDEEDERRDRFVTPGDKIEIDPLDGAIILG